MSYQNPDIARISEELKAKLVEMPDKSVILRDPALKSLYDQLKGLPPEQRGSFGKEVNDLRNELQALVSDGQSTEVEVTPVDITAPWDINTPADKRPRYLDASNGSQHPLMTELNYIVDIFYRMGF